MGEDFVVQVANQAIKVTVMMAAPMLLGALVIGIMISLFQAVTQINEQTLSFIPKILVILGVLVLLSPWMAETMTTFTRELFLEIPNYVAVR